jgi:hypothetical protein
VEGWNEFPTFFVRRGFTSGPHVPGPIPGPFPRRKALPPADQGGRVEGLYTLFLKKCNKGLGESPAGTNNVGNSFHPST